MTRPIVWTIAGSDSGGGAGIQADLHTIQGLGGHGCSVISAITAQNSVAVSMVEPVSMQAFASQLVSLATDMQANAIKIGLLPGGLRAEVLARYLREYRRQWQPFVVLDPVAIASTGRAMAEASLLPALKQHLLPEVDLITPNALELEALTGIAPDSPARLRTGAAALLEMGVRAVLVKGGHLDWTGEQAIDFYTDGQREIWLASPRVQTPHGHGTGCTLSSAIATAVAQDYPIEDALVLAKAYVNQGLKGAGAVGAGAGPVAHLGWPTNLDDFPAVVMPGSALAAQLGITGSSIKGEFAAMDTFRLGLYPVVTSVAWLERLLEQGVRTLQLRIKDKADAEVEEDIKAAVELGQRYKARLFINDYWRLAIRHGAYGVHLGQEDIEVADLEAIRAAGLKLGLSTHGYYEMLRARELKPSYLALGHIFPTKTKEMPSRPQGLERLHRYVALMQGEFPLVAIGGISRERVPLVAETGVGSIALVTAITEAADPDAAIRDLLHLVEG
ncbi:hydroxymethylpyrimidine kinase/phosphomethylpyrimidine kinase/thiamine-phosphate diphosphorylase [Oceanisphaera litoralis]|uniref:thiamine phosphate synthase n=1 Tax=Oceanisphaera litoralis TaxID=225144 RepID=UPI00195BE68B|nr:thiamine phosphate synthase [Oceanisphaera litoralis]MBM7456984.1 hydroxymethylpyrimidine kinase/phosphomethylpyrimidine kinase/thiamine-phosphate diphosphorylase [Oceanisphaera litoralis]